ncbi:MAG: hypothetical protein C0392_04290 [Syntrophus sp. (in: bacteria)]|nr:hypothetical protein [Syntrophus sp. (in: bacteria)]
MDQFETYLSSTVNQGIDHALLVKTSKIYTAPWVRIKCTFGCRGYGKSLCCPPRTPSPDEMRKVLDSYAYAILLHRIWRKGYKDVDKLNETAVDLERTLFLDGYYKAWALGSGPCSRCETCNTDGLCINPQKARPSMEACGIDVFGTVRECGLPIHVVKDHSEERDMYCLVLIE